jgi:mannose-6-phosphate isomerase-like protein (cupin superfamily)
MISKANAENYVWGRQCHGWHLLKLPQLSIVQERVPAGAGEVRHYHQRAEQFFFVLSGVATLEVGGEAERLGPGQGRHVPAGIPHQLYVAGPENSEFLVVSAPLAHGDRVRVAGEAQGHRF